MARMNFNVYIPGRKPTASTAEHPQGIGQRDKPTLTSLGIDVDRLIEEHKQEITEARSGRQCHRKQQAQQQRKSSASTGRKSTNSAASTQQSRHHGRKSGSGSEVALEIGVGILTGKTRDTYFTLTRKDKEKKK